MTRETLGQVRERLLARYRELGGDLARLEALTTAPLDADFAEQATELEELGALEALESAKAAEMRAIRRALARIAQGRYGICEVCGDDIAPARLEALPTATRCIACAA
ncbi:MAG: TraR/DksA C4-type zinc finger protein [Sphingomonadaceae bacterium]|uniref:TraR/DksA family transcriptional regulator n=1 Tax=Thermaurantiacus sp. TaxID=2820283 RepID=UPI00298F329F|nr:TraR/DksA C4-type zinc finger protein [Thermaurantiacus sp.]MCS6987349.1 TraR/DksA C4-type zinc finger protein [Sphingomonadaceae bacterium]MDW8414570.1 TraR/DksA C4-type zinc finger protein [Thermaurantiacus sp.]